MHLNIIEYENSVLVKHAILHEFIFIFVYWKDFKNRTDKFQ